MPETEEQREHLLSPSGRFCIDVLVEGSKYASIDSLHHFGGATTVDDWSLGDTPEMEIYEMSGGQHVVVDTDREEWLSSHCRVIVGDFEPEEYEEEGVISPWPEDIQKMCGRVLRLHDVVRCIGKLKKLAPLDFADTTTAVVLDQVVTKRCEVEIATLQAKIDKYREDDPRVVMPDEVEEDEDA